MPRLRKRTVTQGMEMKYRTTIQKPEREPVTCNPGDWLLQDADGDQYFVTASVFHKSYEILPDPADDAA